VSPRIVLAAALVLGAAAPPVLSQTEEIQNKVDAKLAAERARLAEERVRADVEKATREQYEEIEILARLLDRGLIRDAHAGPLGDSMGSVAFSPDGKLVASEGPGGSVRLWDAATGKQIAAHAAHFSGTEGVYLKGQGVVYSLTLPLHFQKAVADPDKPAPKELTDWERVRRELRGEKVEAAKPRAPGGTSIADAVLKVLADNGKNLTRLPEGEGVTVAITLRAPQACVNCHSGPGGGMMRGGGMPGMASGGMGMSPPGGGMPPGGPARVSHEPPQGGGPGAAGSGIGGGGAEPGVDTSRAEFRKYVLLGDLAMKQHDYTQAVQAYAKASAVYKEPPTESDALLEMIEMGTKMARTLTALGKRAEADQVVKSIAKLTDRLASAAPAKAPDGKPQVPLPAKLIIKVSKKDLDLTGSGRIDFAAFRKGASVEHLTFDKPAEKPKGDSGKQ
jgi:hypothetical protein